MDTVAVLNAFFHEYIGVIMILTWLVGAGLLILLHGGQQRELDRLRQILNAVRYDLEESRNVERVNSPVAAAPVAFNEAQYETELSAYREIWTRMSALHESVGLFLRSIEMRDRAQESRLAARTAATAARDSVHGLRPFCHETVEGLVFDLLDKYIQVHLAACSYLDTESDDKAEAARLKQPVSLENLRQRSKTVYEGEAKQLLDVLAKRIRQRLTSMHRDDY